MPKKKKALFDGFFIDKLDREILTETATIFPKPIYTDLVEEDMSDAEDPKGLLDAIKNKLPSEVGAKKAVFAPGFKHSWDRMFSSNPRYAIPRWIRDARYNIRMAWQRLTRGWDESSAWGYHHWHNKTTVEQLEYLRKIHHGCPSGLCHGDGYHFSAEKEGDKCEWDEILTDIIEGFKAEQKQDDLWWEVSDKDERDLLEVEYQHAIDRGWDLYRHYYRNLWD